MKKWPSYLIIFEHWKVYQLGVRMLKQWRVPLYPDWINAENTIIWLVTFLNSKCQTSKSQKQMHETVTKNSQSFLFQPKNWCQNGLNFKRLSSKAGLTIRERHFHFIWPSLSILGRFKSVLFCWQSCPEMSWMLKVQLLKFLHSFKKIEQQ